MSTVIYRFDYLKLLLVTPRGTFHQYYRAIVEAAAKKGFDGLKWDRSHKVQSAPSIDGEWERTFVDIWGEAAELLWELPFNPWHEWIKRLDIRATLWDVEEDSVLFTGQRLQRNVSSLNIEVFSSKPASKRMGRDRGGKGFRVGSRKSDVCVVVYKRTREPAAQEFRFQGQALLNAINPIADELGHLADVCDLWAKLEMGLRARGERRLERALNEAGIGTYWPLFNHAAHDDHEGLQRQFITEAAYLDASEHYEGHWRGEAEERNEAKFNGDITT